MRRAEVDNLVRVKSDLAAKYRRKAAAAGSKPQRAALLRKADRFQRRAEDAGRLATA